MNMEGWIDFPYLYIPPKMGKTLARFGFYNEEEDKMDNFEDAYYEICIDLPDGYHTLDEGWNIDAECEAKKYKNLYPDYKIDVIRYKFDNIVYSI